MPRKMTMKQIAELAGCSISQVSRVLNENGSVKPELRDRIREIASEHHFRINITSHHVRLCFLRDGIGYFSNELVAGLEEACAKRNWRLYTIRSIVSPKELWKHSFDGFFSGRPGKLFQQEWVKYQQIPLVMLNSYGITGGEICSVEPDSFDEAMQVLQHLKSLGHRKIARFNYCSDPMRGYAGFMRAAQELELPEVIDVHDKVFSQKHFLTNSKKLIESGVTAFFILHQSFALQTVQLLKAAGFRIPQDISVVTYMRKEISEFCDPPLTTLEFDFNGIGESACEIMALRLQGKPCPVKHICVPNLPLMIRSSTGPAPKR